MGGSVNDSVPWGDDAATLFNDRVNDGVNDRVDDRVNARVNDRVNAPWLFMRGSCSASRAARETKLPLHLDRHPALPSTILMFM